MKRTAAILSILLMLLPALVAGGREASGPRQTATLFWNSHRPAGIKPADTAALEPLAVDGLNHILVFRHRGQGFVVVADRAAAPAVLAYSYDSPFPDTLHPALRYWLSGYDSQLATDTLLPTSGAMAPTPTLTDPAPDAPLASTATPALLTTLWDQSAPFNQSCPYDSARRERTVVGCVATAMAQIMKYWNHPLCGSGSHSYTYRNYGPLSADFAATSYMWEYMPNLVYGSSDIVCREAVQTLSYHCGVAVDMMYGPASTGGSGAYSSKVADALKTYFRYKPTLAYRERGSYSDRRWTNMIDADLAARRPIYYSGRDSTGGHAFVLDGADTTGRYHFNWGWGGMGNGYYRLDNLNPGGGGAGSNASNTFNLYQAAIFGIEPLPQPQPDTLDIYDTVCYNAYKYIFHEYKLPPVSGDYLLHHLDTICRVHVTQAQRLFIHLDPNTGERTSTTVAYCPLTGVELPRSMYARPGYIFRGWCLDIDGHDSIYLPGDTLRIRSTRMVYAIWQDTTSPRPAIDSLAYLSSTIAVFPNPARNQVLVTTGGAETAECTLRDAVGRLLRRFSINGGSGQISLDGLAPGVFILSVNDGKHTYNRRIIKL